MKDMHTHTQKKKEFREVRQNVLRPLCPELFLLYSGLEVTRLHESF